MKLLWIDGCVRGEQSRTLALTRTFLDAFTAKHPDWTVERVDLSALDLRPYVGAALDKRGEDEQARRFDGAEYDLAKQFIEADKIVLAAPFWELCFPAVVKLYLEHISVVNLVFRYAPDGGTIGMCKADKLLYIATRGGNYADS